MLRWSLMLFVLSMIEETLGHANAAEGSRTIATISFLLAISLFVMFHRMHDHQESNRR